VLHPFQVLHFAGVAPVAAGRRTRRWAWLASCCSAWGMRKKDVFLLIILFAAIAALFAVGCGA
jgi:hypothetical protein